MNAYVNRFSFALNDREDEVSIVFAQEAPQISDTGAINNISYEPAASLVMNRHMAIDLANKLLEALKSENTASTGASVQ